jgi:hypothetical protein
VKARRLLACLVLVYATVPGLQAQTQAEPTLEPAVELTTAGLRKELEEEITRLSEAVARLEQLRVELDERHQQLGADAGEADERIAQLRFDLRRAEPGSAGVEHLFTTVASELVAARSRLAGAHTEWRSPSSVPAVSQPDLSSFDLPALQAELDQVEQLWQRIQELAEHSRAQEQELRWHQVVRAGTAAEQLDRLRIEGLARLPAEQREKLLGVTREGIAQLLGEIEHLVLMARRHRETRLQSFAKAGRLTGDLFVIGAVIWTLLRLALVLVVVVYVRSRWQPMINQLRRSLFRRLHRIAWKRYVDTTISILEVLMPAGILVLAVIALRWALGPAAAWPELDLVIALAMIFALYRLAVDAVVGLVNAIRRRYQVRLAADRRAKLAASVRTVLRAVALIAVLLLLSERLVGRGYLLHLVVQLSWLVVLLSLLAILLGWRQIIADTFLRHHPEHRLAGLVRRTRDRWYGMLVAPACFLWLAGRTLLVVTRELALGFTLTHKVLAFVFRRQIERQAEVKGYAEGEIDELPERLTEAFSEQPVSSGAGVIDLFPGLDQLGQELQAWHECGTGGAGLVTGECGAGKTTWLNQVDGQQVPVLRIAPEQRPQTAGELGRLLAAAFDMTETSRQIELDRLVEQLLLEPRRIVVLDRAENLFLGCVGGYEPFDAFATLVEQTRHQLFWLCAMNRFAWQRLYAVRTTPAVFRFHQHLPGWDEESIRDLIQSRIAVAGVEASYRDLVLDQLEGVSAQARLIKSEEGYARLLWDYSDGNPKVALHFFMRSLVPAHWDRVRVRLFKGPQVEQLEEIGEQGLFVLAAIITHVRLTLEELVKVTRYPEKLCRIYLDRLVDLGTLGRDQNGYQVTTYWQRATVRLLLRLNLLAR